MGIYERDYVRERKRGGAAVGGVLGGPVRGLSVNSWIIIANVAVFILTHVVVIGPNTMTDFGRAYDAASTPEQRARSVEDKQVRRGADGLPYFPIRDPQKPMVRGGMMIVGSDGKPLAEEIGQHRFQVMPLLESWGHFSTGKVVSGLEVWRFVTFQFLHFNTMHIVLNMLGLFFFGWVVEEYLGRARYLAYYLACGAGGALFYLILNLAGYLTHARVPGLLFQDPYTPLIGASAGVFGVLMACAFISPNTRVQLLFPPVSLKTKTFAYGYLGVAVLSLLVGTRNAGGEAAHVGGAAAGAYLIRRGDVLWAIVGFFTGKGRERGKLRVRRRSEGVAGVEPTVGGRNGWREVDRVLAKISESGSESLTADEKAVLERERNRLEGSGRV